jgi:arabinose operon protein AraL
MEISHLENFDGFVFDLDGTIYLGEKALPGAVECIREIRSRGKKTVFITNKPLESRKVYAKKLTHLGIPTPPEQVITSAFVLGHHLVKKLPELQYYIIGETNLIEELRGYGLQVVDEFNTQDPLQVINPIGIDAVIVAFDRTLDYRKINTAYQALMHGARFFATNADKACPMPGGAIPDAGGTITALEYMTGRKLELLGGKPSALMMQVVSEMLNLAPERCLLTGDRLETDTLMGKQAGFRTALVLTGVTKRKDMQVSEVRPDLVLDNLFELI